MSENQNITITGEKILTCRYGENAYQTPAFLYSRETDDPLGLDKLDVIAGASPSYNNVCDIDRLLQTITHIAAGFDQNFNAVPLCGVAVKHGNACGAAVGEDSCEVLKKIVSGDPRAIFGGLVMVNFEIGLKEAEVLLTHGMEKGRRLLDGIIAPSFTDEAIEMLKRKKDKCRFLANEALLNLNKDSLDIAPRFRYVRGGFLTQPNYTYIFDLNHPELEIYGDLLSDSQSVDLILGWAINATSNSNTITLVKNSMLIGNGSGQQDRISAAQLAIKKAKDANHSPMDAVAISDSFFPFPDAPKELCMEGVSVISTTSDSVNDGKVIKVILNNDVTLLMISDKIGRVFYGH